MLNDTLLITFIVVAFLFIASRTLRSKQGHPLPPGPPGWPLIGNIDAPTEYLWTKYSEFGRTYGTLSRLCSQLSFKLFGIGDLVYFQVFGRPYIILNSRRLCVEFFEKRYQNYSNRPQFEMLAKIVGWAQTTFFLPVDKEWRDHRRNFTKLLGTRALMQKFHSMQVKETRKFMRDLMRNPERLDHHVRQ